MLECLSRRLRQHGSPRSRVSDSGAWGRGFQFRLDSAVVPGRDVPARLRFPGGAGRLLVEQVRGWHALGRPDEHLLLLGQISREALDTLPDAARCGPPRPRCTRTHSQAVLSDLACFVVSSFVCCPFGNKRTRAVERQSSCRGLEPRRTPVDAQWPATVDYQ